MMLTLETAPAKLPVDMRDVKEQLRIDSDAEDAALDRLLRVATAYVDGEGALGRALITQTWAQHVQRTVGDVKLQMLPFQSLTSVQYYDPDNVLQTATLSNFEVVGAANNKILRPKDGFTWPSTEDRPDAVKITYVAGYGDNPSDIPESIRHAILMLVTHWFERREPSSDRRMVEVPWGVEALLNIERTRWYG